MCTYFVSAVCCSIHCISTVRLLNGWVDQTVFFRNVRSTRPLLHCVMRRSWVGSVQGGRERGVMSVMAELLYWVLSCYTLWGSMMSVRLSLPLTVVESWRQPFCCFYVKRLIKPVCACWLLNCLKVCSEQIRELVLTNVPAVVFV